MRPSRLTLYSIALLPAILAAGVPAGCVVNDQTPTHGAPAYVAQLASSAAHHTWSTAARVWRGLAQFARTEAIHTVPETELRPVVIDKPRSPFVGPPYPAM